MGVSAFRLSLHPRPFARVLRVPRVYHAGCRAGGADPICLAESSGGRVAININNVRLDAVGLTDSLRRDWIRIGWALPEERADIRKHIRWCLQEITRLSSELEAMLAPL